MTSSDVPRSASKEPSTVFFTAGARPSFSFDPYAGIPTARDAKQDQIPSLLGVVDGAAREILSVPERRLAWHLTAPPRLAPRAIDFARALRDGKAQRDTAAHLLAEAVAGEAAEMTGPLARERWGTVDRLWSELARSAAVAGELRRVANHLGLPRPDATTAKVLAAITTELLPSLHLIFATATDDPEHRALHLAGADGAPDHPLTALARATLRAEKLAAARRLHADSHHAEALWAYVALEPGERRETPRLARELGDLAAAVQKTASTCTFIAAQNLIRALGAALNAYPFDVRICLAMAALHARSAILLLEHNRFNEAGVHLVRASALDPADPAPLDLLRSIRQELAAAGLQLTSAVQEGRVLNYLGTALLAEVKADMHEAAVLLGSSEHTGLRETHEAAVAGELAVRLGLDPTDSDEQSAARAIVAALRPKSEDRAARAWRIAVLLASQPALAGAPGETIRAAEERDAPLCPEGLIAALPAPPRVPENIDSAALRKAMIAMRKASGPEEGAQRRRFNPARAYPWLFSRLDPRAKLAAAAGLSLLLVGCGLLGRNAHDASRRNDTYAELRSAAAESRHKDVIRAARGFMASTRSEAEDYRAREVARAYQKALLQEIAQATSGAAEQDLPQLLADARALAAWTPRASASGTEDKQQ
jgi:hypothetical protein